MIATIRLLLTAALVVLGASAVSEAGLPAAVALAVAALALALLAAIVLPSPSGAALARPRAGIDVSIVPAQCDPDASGHARPRAPGLAAPAA